jgi:phosphatidylserine decarboxylase
VAALPAAGAMVFGAPPAITVILGVLPIAIGLFFRDPNRTALPDPSLVLSPADGTVMHAGPARPGEAPEGEWKQITIFLSVLDVHINRTPVAGRVTRVQYFPGAFRAAFHHDAHSNERSEIWIDHGGVTIVFRQVVGMLARRVVCRVAPGDELGPGQRIGLMKFGSRMDVFVPMTAEILVQKGAKVRAAETVVARLTAGRS